MKNVRCTDIWDRDDAVDVLNEEITNLRQRVKELEAENERLRQIWRGTAGSSFGPPRTGEPL